MAALALGLALASHPEVPVAAVAAGLGCGLWVVARAPKVGALAAMLVLGGAAAGDLRLAAIDAPAGQVRDGRSVRVRAWLATPVRPGRFGSSAEVTVASGPLRGVRLLARASQWAPVAAARRSGRGPLDHGHPQEAWARRHRWLRRPALRAHGPRRWPPARRHARSAGCGAASRGDGGEGGTRPGRGRAAPRHGAGRGRARSTRACARTSAPAAWLTCSPSGAERGAAGGARPSRSGAGRPRGPREAARPAAPGGRVYVPLAGAGPALQRAGVMGAAGIAASAASGRARGAYALLLAAAVTLPQPAGGGRSGMAALVRGGRRNPRAGAARDARRWRRCGRTATARAGPVRVAIARGGEARPASPPRWPPRPCWRSTSARVPLAGLPANLLALPAVAPIMWLGMVRPRWASCGARRRRPIAEALAGLGWVPACRCAALCRLARAFADVPGGRSRRPCARAAALLPALRAALAAVARWLPLLRRADGRGRRRQRARGAGCRRAPCVGRRGCRRRTRCWSLARLLARRGLLSRSPFASWTWARATPR